MDRVDEHLSTPRGDFAIQSRKPTAREQRIIDLIKNGNFRGDMILDASFTLPDLRNHNKQWDEKIQRYKPPFIFQFYSIHHLGNCRFSLEGLKKLESMKGVKLEIPLEFIIINDIRPNGSFIFR